MKPLLIAALCLALSAFAADDSQDVAAALAAVKDLGTANGQALACGLSDAAARAKTLMLAHSPRTYAYGDAFQSATNNAFTDQTHRSADQCPNAAALAAKLDALSGRLDKLLPNAAGEPR
jgi:hypothetical protein